MSRVFISYRRADSEGYVGRLYDHLIQHFDTENIFMDIDDIAPGQDFVQVIENAVNECDVVLVVMGPTWLTVTDEGGNRRLDSWNDFVRLEIASALKANKLVIPVLVQRATMPSPSDLPEEIQALARRNAIELNHRSFVHDMRKLVEVVEKVVPRAIQIDIDATKPQPDQAKPRLKLPPAPEQEAALKKIRDELFSFKDSPLYTYRTESNYFPVPGDGYANARIMFIGEAPGQNEAEQGKVFIGASGNILDEMLKGVGLAREEVFITNILKDRAPGNRDPVKAELEAYEPFLTRQIEIIKPEIIVTLGRFAMDYVLKKFEIPTKKPRISELHGKLIKADAGYGEIYVMPMYHPAVILYSPSSRDTVKQDFEKLKMFV